MSNRYSFDDLRAIVPIKQAVGQVAIPKVYRNDSARTKELAIEALSTIPRRIPGTNTYPDYRHILWSMKAILGESEAIQLMEAHSPSYECGWNIEQVARSGGEKIGPGTLFHYAKNWGNWEFPESKKPPKLSANSEIEPIESSSNTGYVSDWETGLRFQDCNSQPGSKIVTRIGNHLEAVGYCQTPTGDGAAVVLEFRTIQGNLAAFLMPRHWLAGDGTEIVAKLLAMGYWFYRSEKTRLLSYLQGLGGGVQNQYLLMPNTGLVEI